MICDDVRYHRPATADEAATLLLQAGPQGVVLGGGSMVVPQMVRSERRATDVVDLRGLGLAAISTDASGIELGAMVTYGTVLRADPLPGAARLLQQMADGVTGGAQLRNLATLAGSAAYANPCSDAPGALAALGTIMCLHGPDGPRQVPVEEFFLDAHKTALGPGEFLRSMRIPAQSARTAYLKVKAGSSGWPVVTASAVLTESSASVTIGAAQARPTRIDVTSLRQGDGWDLDGLVEIAREAIEDPWHDAQGPGHYRKHVAGVLARRVVERAESS